MGWIGTSSTFLRPFTGLLYQHWVIDGDNCGAISGIIEWQGKPKYLEIAWPSAALSTTGPKWLDVGSNLGRRSGKPATWAIARL
jgi:hypothetical protein